VLVYTAAVQGRPLSIAGQVLAEVWISADANDADWMVKLIDVAANGVAQGIAEGVLRSSARDPLKYPALLEPGRRYRVRVDLGHTAVTFFRAMRCVSKWLAVPFPCSIGTSIPVKVLLEPTNRSVAKLSITARPRLRGCYCLFCRNRSEGRPSPSLHPNELTDESSKRRAGQLQDQGSAIMVPVRGFRIVERHLKFKFSTGIQFD
jgi:hypothetical protein